MMVSFVLSFFPRGALDEILNLIESVSEGFPSYSFILCVSRYIENQVLADSYFTGFLFALTGNLPKIQ